MSLFKGSTEWKCHTAPPTGPYKTNSTRHLPENFNRFFCKHSWIDNFSTPDIKRHFDFLRIVVILAVDSVLRIRGKRHFLIRQIHATNATFEAVRMKYEANGSNYFSLHFASTHLAIHVVSMELLVAFRAGEFVFTIVKRAQDWGVAFRAYLLVFLKGEKLSLCKYRVIQY